MKKKIDLGTANTALIIVPKWSYAKDFPSVIHDISSISKKAGYISLSKPYLSLMSLLKSQKLDADNTFILDLITRSVLEPKEVDNCVYIDSPANFTDISIAISELVKQDLDLLFFDSISTFLIYKDTEPIIKLIHNIITKIKVNSKKGIFLCIKEERSQELIDNVSMFVDKVIEI